jgi:hypothetical protein
MSPHKSLKVDDVAFWLLAPVLSSVAAKLTPGEAVYIAET